MEKPRQTRKIGPTRRSVSGYFSFRGNAPVPFESTLERDFLAKMDFNLEVLDVIAQPVQIPFTARTGLQYTYTPDYLVYYRLGDHTPSNYPKPLLVEVKPESEWRANWKVWLPKWKSAYRHAKENGWEFHIYDESRIRDQELTNIQFLARYQRSEFPEEESIVILQTIHEMGAATMDYLLAKHFMGHYRLQGIAHIWHLLSTRRIECDMHQPLNDVTEFWVPTNG